MEARHDQAARQRFAQVEVPVPVPGPFTYAVPESLRGLALPGMRVRVLFGRRQLTGTIVSTSDRPPEELDPAKIRPLGDCLDPEPLLTPVLLELARWVAGSTMSSWGEAIRTALPARLSAVGQRRVALTREGAILAADAAAAAAQSGAEISPGSAGGGIERILRTLVRAGSKGLKLSTLRKRLPDDPVCGVAYALAAEGLVAVEDEWAEGIGGRWQRGLRPTRGVSIEQAREVTARAPAQRHLVEVLWDHPEGLPVATLSHRAACAPGTISALLGRGIVESYRVPVPREALPLWTDATEGVGEFELTAAQAAALNRVEAALEGGSSQPILIHGVTGSGKTEIYLRAAAKVVGEGRAAVLLVPEIGLTPLLEQRARAVLGDQVAVMHSAMSAGERLASWWKARCGGAPVVIGPRSAVFAPLDDVGLIVIDEEQDAAYKQDESPRYHGREVALRRAELEGAAVVLGSATPAIESFHGARSGAYELLRLPERVADRPLPEVTVIDMREGFKRTGRTLLSVELEEAVGERLGRAEQALLLLNRRGFANSMLCRVCGERVPCPNCSVSLTVHRRRGSLICHYCDFRAPIPPACPQCGADQVQEVGHGTQQLQEAIERLFPQVRCRRFDADETRRRGAHARILAAFSRGEIDILVGTQMLAKGHDFAGVTLVGVVGADESLGFPDFRAAERTFQLLTQMAGRAGRGDISGTVILQAFKPDHYAIRAAVAQDYEGFFEQEIEFRRRLRYPPFASLISCVCQGKNLPAVKEDADRLAAAVRRCGGDEVRVLGPASPLLARLRGQHRLQVLINSPTADGARESLSAALEDLRQNKRLPRDLRIDVEPVNLM